MPREDIFLTAKVWIEHYGYEQAKASVTESLRKLKTDYLDLVLQHQPFSDTYGAWRALEELYDKGKIRAIGISNFYADRMVDFASFNRIKPKVNQMETHIFQSAEKLKRVGRQVRYPTGSMAPFGEGRGGTFDNPVTSQIGEKYGKTAAQVMLRWNIQRGVVVIPKSTHIERSKTDDSNISVSKKLFSKLEEGENHLKRRSFSPSSRPSTPFLGWRHSEFILYRQPLICYFVLNFRKNAGYTQAL